MVDKLRKQTTALAMLNALKPRQSILSNGSNDDDPNDMDTIFKVSFDFEKLKSLLAQILGDLRL